MKKTTCWLLTLLVMVTYSSSFVAAQGPPITGDKPIMLASGNMLLKTLTEVRKTNQGTFVKAPLMFHYVLRSNALVSIHLPFVSYNFDPSIGEQDGTGIGDIELMAKYQFYRKDKKRRTFRVVAKTLQRFPTGKKLGIEDISTGQYQSYMAVVAGYETIKYGISNELGYNLVPNSDQSELKYKLGFGLPLLKPLYPVNQINLYFEYQGSYYTQTTDYQLLYAQGIQYAKKQLTFDFSVQVPLVQAFSDSQQNLKYSLFFGTRYVF